MQGQQGAAGAHPHSRGENVIEGTGSPILVGSSPLTRGKLLVALSAGDAGGLIPTHAGKTRCSPEAARR